MVLIKKCSKILYLTFLVSLLVYKIVKFLSDFTGRWCCKQSYRLLHCHFSNPRIPFCEYVSYTFEFKFRDWNVLTPCIWEKNWVYFARHDMKLIVQYYYIFIFRWVECARKNLYGTFFNVCLPKRKDTLYQIHDSYCESQH